MCNYNLIFLDSSIVILQKTDWYDLALCCLANLWEARMLLLRRLMTAGVSLPLSSHLDINRASCLYKKQSK